MIFKVVMVTIGALAVYAVWRSTKKTEVGVKHIDVSALPKGDADEKEEQ